MDKNIIRQERDLIFSNPVVQEVFGAYIDPDRKPEIVGTPRSLFVPFDRRDALAGVNP